MEKASPQQPSVTDPAVKREPVDFCPSLSENLASPVAAAGEIFGLYGATFTDPVHIICLCLKKAKQRPDPATFFPENPAKLSRCHWVCYRAVYLGEGPISSNCFHDMNEKKKV